jgi:hypothetical protein
MTDEASKRAEELHEAGMTLSQAGDEDAAVERYGAGARPSPAAG